MQGADDGVAAEILDLLIQFPGLRRALVVRSGEFRADTAETLREGGDPLGNPGRHHSGAPSKAGIDDADTHAGGQGTRSHFG
jgi:hypothetical protein